MAWIACPLFQNGIYPISSKITKESPLLVGNPNFLTSLKCVCKSIFERLSVINTFAYNVNRYYPYIWWTSSTELFLQILKYPLHFLLTFLLLGQDRLFITPHLFQQDCLWVGGHNIELDPHTGSFSGSGCFGYILDIFPVLLLKKNRNKKMPWTLNVVFSDIVGCKLWETVNSEERRNKAQVIFW